jgi:hypothetical protein
VVAAEPGARIQADEMLELDFESGFLSHFTNGSLCERLALVDRAAGKTPDLEILATSQ